MRIRALTRYFTNASSSDEYQPTYEYQEDTESLERYSKGGYHPVSIGDKYLQGHYHVIHKLGYGSYSTVWLARDSLLQRYVALKVLDADSSVKSTEAQVLQHLSVDSHAHQTGKRYIRSFHDSFWIDGPNGSHLCLASAPTRCSVAESKRASLVCKFPINIARAITAQIVLGLSYIHGKGVIHGGKISPLTYLDYRH